LADALCVAIDGVVALATLDETTTARIGTGAALDLTGDLEIAASNEGENEATATGDTKSADVGIGAAVAAIVGGGTANGAFDNTSVTSAELARSVTADALTLSADADRSYAANATATAGGGKAEPDGNKSESTKTLDKTASAQVGTNGQDPKDTTKASGGKISVAAAAGVVAAQDVASARLDGVTVTLGGDLEIDASNATHVTTLGSGAAVGSKGNSSKVGIGVGVALSIDNDTTTAAIADGANIAKAGKVGVTAASFENTDKTGESDFAKKGSAGVGAEAYAGATASKAAVAGALAVEYSTATTTAAIGDNVKLGTSAGHVGAIEVTTDNTSSFSSLASSQASQGKVGVGASIAVDYSANSYDASVGAGASVLTVAGTHHVVLADPEGNEFCVAG